MIAAAAALTARETKDVPTVLLGKKTLPTTTDLVNH